MASAHKRSEALLRVSGSGIASQLQLCSGDGGSGKPHARIFKN